MRPRYYEAYLRSIRMEINPKHYCDICNDGIYGFPYKNEAYMAFIRNNTDRSSSAIISFVCKKCFDSIWEVKSKDNLKKILTVEEENELLKKENEELKKQLGVKIVLTED